jgi:hypothetical protein
MIRIYNLLSILFKIREDNKKWKKMEKNSIFVSRYCQ